MAQIKRFLQKGINWKYPKTMYNIIIIYQNYIPLQQPVKTPDHHRL